MTEKELLEKLSLFQEGQLDSEEMIQFEDALKISDSTNPKILEWKAYFQGLFELEAPPVSENFLVEFKRRLQQEKPQQKKGFWEYLFSGRGLSIQTVGSVLTLVLIVGIYFTQYRPGTYPEHEENFEVQRSKGDEDLEKKSSSSDVTSEEKKPESFGEVDDTYQPIDESNKDDKSNKGYVLKDRTKDKAPDKKEEKAKLKKINDVDKNRLGKKESKKIFEGLGKSGSGHSKLMGAGGSSSSKSLNKGLSDLSNEEIPSQKSMSKKGISNNIISKKRKMKKSKPVPIEIANKPSVKKLQQASPSSKSISDFEEAEMKFENKKMAEQELLNREAAPEPMAPTDDIKELGGDQPSSEKSAKREKFSDSKVSVSRNKSKPQKRTVFKTTTKSKKEKKKIKPKTKTTQAAPTIVAEVADSQESKSIHGTQKIESEFQLNKTNTLEDLKKIGNKLKIKFNVINKGMTYNTSGAKCKDLIPELEKVGKWTKKRPKINYKAANIVLILNLVPK